MEVHLLCSSYAELNTHCIFKTSSQQHPDWFDQISLVTYYFKWMLFVLFCFVCFFKFSDCVPRELKKKTKQVQLFLCMVVSLVVLMSQFFCLTIESDLRRQMSRGGEALFIFRMMIHWLPVFPLIPIYSSASMT